MTDNAKIKVNAAPNLSREGAQRTLYFYSFSGFFVVDENLPILDGHLNHQSFEIKPPTRISEPTFRPTPQFTKHSFRSQFRVEGEIEFPINISAFPSHVSGGASLNYWLGAGATLDPSVPSLPPDTLTIVLEGENSGAQSELVERHILKPFVEWLRVLTDQWWIGRSFEGVSGPLHLLIALNDAGNVIGSPMPVTQIRTAGIRFRKISPKIWMEAGDLVGAQKRPPASRILVSDAEYMLASREFRSSMISACCAIEASRDECLARNSTKIAKLRCSRTDLLQHLSVGFETAFNRNLKHELPELFAYLRAFWIARGDAAHGRPIDWHIGEKITPIDEAQLSGISDKACAILDWIDKV